MKRPLAIALTIAIFAAIAVCFLRPVPNVFGHPKPIFEPNTPLELSGDTEYFERAEVKYVNYAEGLIELHLQPVEPYILHVDDGFVEKLTDGKWEYLCRTGYGGSMTLEGGPPSHFSLVWDSEEARLKYGVNSKYGQRYRVDAAEPMRNPGDYRFTLNFQPLARVDNSDRAVGDAISISFTCTVPKPTDKRFDVFTMDFYHPCVAIRSNDGSPAPYIAGDSIRMTNTETGETIGGDGYEWEIAPAIGSRWYDSYDTPEEDRLFRAFSFTPTKAPNGNNPELELVKYSVYLEFSENKDGSGERYPFTFSYKYVRDK